MAIETSTLGTERDVLKPIAPPLCVDLDGTLLKTDLLWETLVALLKREPLAFFRLPVWLASGRAHLKRELARRVRTEIKYLPFRDDLLQFLREEKAKGRPIILITAADEIIAREVQKHLHVFDEVIGSNGVHNMRGATKALVLEGRFGARGFDYVGDSNVDFEVWRVSRHALVVTNRARFVRAINSFAPVEKVFPRSRNTFAVVLRALRSHQWSKNLLVVVPILTGHQLANLPILLRGAVAFCSFSLVCSGVYLLNDILDLDADRSHQTKRLRPLAAGDLSITTAVVLSAVTLLAGVSVGIACGLTFLGVLAIYLVANLAYSTWLKHVVMLDVVVLACFYTLRLLGGGAATGIGCSEWLLAFSVFFFFCLAMIKRYSELRESTAIEPQMARSYARSDLDSVALVGVSSGMISVLVLVLYAMSPEVRILYHKPTVLLLLCPLFLYWITRLWFKAHRGEVPQDPVLFALTDRTSYIAGLLAALVLYIATF